MPPERVPGPMCIEGQESGTFYVDDGTSCLAPSVSPNPLTPNGSDLHSLICEAPISNDQPVEDKSSGDRNEVVVIDWDKWVKEVSALIAGYGAAGKDVVQDLAPALKKLGITGKAVIREYNGKRYVIIKGYAGLRKILTGTRYLATHTKVVDLVIGTGNLAKSAIKSGALSIVLVTADNVVQFILEDKDLLSREFAFTLTTNLTKAAISGIVGFLAAAGLAAMSAPVAVPIAGGILVGLVVSKGLDAIFPTEEIVKVMEEYYQSLSQKINRGLNQLEREIIWRFAPDVYHLIYR